MQVTIISGSHSADSQSARIAHYLRRHLVTLQFIGDWPVALHDVGARLLFLWQLSCCSLTAKGQAKTRSLLLKPRMQQ